MDQNKSDVFSFAIITYEVLFQKFAWPLEMPIHDIMTMVVRGARPIGDDEIVSFYKSSSPDLFFRLSVDIMAKAWRQKPHERPTFEDIKAILEDG